MDSLELLVLFLSYLAAFVATSLALVAWQRSSLNWARPFAVMMLALAQWSLALALELSATTMDAMRGWRMLQIVGASIVPAAWFVFAARYSEQQHLVSSHRRRILYAIPLLTNLLALTNGSHGAIWRDWTMAPTGALSPEYGVWHTVHLVYSCLLAVAGTLLLWQTGRGEQRHARWFIAAVILGAAIPFAGYLLQVFGASVPGAQNAVPFLLLLAVALLAWTVRRHQILEIVPIAHQTVLHNMPDGVIVVNNQDRIAEINPAATRIVGSPAAEVVGRRFVEVMPQWSDLWYDAVIKGELETELDWPVDKQMRSYDMRLLPVLGRSRMPTGRLIILRDITSHKETERELNARQQLFEKLVAVARATAEDTSLQATLQNALDVTTGLTGAEYGSLFLLDSDGRVTHSILARGRTAPGSRRRIVGTVMNEGLAGWALRNRATVLVYDTNEDDRWVTFADQPYVARSVLVVPITSATEVPGVLTLQHSEPGFFDEADEALLRAASDQMALALHNAQLFEEQRQLASRQQILYEALKTIGKHLEPGTVVQLAAEIIARLTGWKAVGIFMPPATGGTLELIASSGQFPAWGGEEIVAVRDAAARAFHSGKTHSEYDGDGQPATDGSASLRGVLYVPLTHAGRRFGLLLVGKEEAAPFDADDQLLAESLAEAVALAMTNARLFQVIADEHSRLEALIEASRDGVILAGNRQEILFLNHMALQLLGTDSTLERWLNRPLSDLFLSLEDSAAPAFLRAMAPDVASTAPGEPDEGEGEIEINKRVLRWQNLPVSTETTLVGRLIVLQDVSQEHALQRLRDDLTHTMVHDLRNPLNAVNGSLELLDLKLGNQAGADGKQLLLIAKEGVRRMLHLVNGILSISRLESGRIPLNRELLTIPEIVDQVLEAQSPLAQEKGLHLEWEVGRLNGHQQAQVYADRELIERVLQNLVGNAIKFTPRNGTVSVSLRAADEQDELIVAVEDSGPGVPPEIRDQLFQKFVSGTQPERGSGLGLSFCRMAVEAHGGRIWFEDSGSGGAQFLFTLPLLQNGDDPTTESS